MDPLANVAAIEVGSTPAATAVRTYLRQLIMQGLLAPGTTLPQVQLAERLGISRTPLREAMRMLQEEGLVEAEPQRRARVALFDPAHLEAVYVQRVVLESMGAMVTAGRTEPHELDELDALMREMDALSLAREPERWQTVHRQFHLQLIRHAGAPLIKSVAANMEFGERYRLLYQSAGPRAWRPAFDEHARIVDEFRAGDAERAAAELASHLARTALVLIAEIAPSYDPGAVRSALTLFHGEIRKPPKGIDPPPVVAIKR